MTVFRFLCFPTENSVVLEAHGLGAGSLNCTTFSKTAEKISDLDLGSGHPKSIWKRIPDPGSGHAKSIWKRIRISDLATPKFSENGSGSRIWPRPKTDPDLGSRIWRIPDLIPDPVKKTDLVRFNSLLNLVFSFSWIFRNEPTSPNLDGFPNKIVLQTGAVFPTTTQNNGPSESAIPESS